MPIKGKNNVVISNNELESVYIDYVYRKIDSDILIVTSTTYEANKIYNSLIKYNNNTSLYLMDDFVTSEASISSPELEINRLETLNSIVFCKNKNIVITNLMGLLRFLPEKKLWNKSLITLKLNIEINKEELVRKLNNIGYKIETLVTKTGELANRGYILDIFPINEDNPIRIEFFGDTIESIRYFDINNQLSLKNINEVNIYPFSEFIVNEDVDDDNRKQKYLNKYEKVSNICEYLNNPIVFFKDYNQIYNSYLILLEEILNYKEINKDKLEYMNSFKSIYSNIEVYMSNINDIIQNRNFDNIYTINSGNVKDYNDDFKLLKEDLQMYTKNSKTVIICLNNQNQINNIVKYLDISLKKTDIENIYENKINVILKNIEDGYIYDNYVVLSEKNLFKNIEKNTTFKSKFKYGTKISNIKSLNIGDYVVHNLYGIGIYKGIVAINKGNILKDYLQIIYKGNDKLYIPVEKIDLISKYSSNENITPKLTSLNGTEWQKTKIRIRNRLKDIAGELLKLAAERKLNKGYAFKKDTVEQSMFESEFIYEETEDQLKAIEVIKAAMEEETPMDMLLCGDVGYGKTEVAFRAIFKAICSNKQVAYLCPTTILSNQQYTSALSRFKNFPVNIALLNRFTTKKEVNNIIDKLKKGQIDILFGTHRILSKDVEFNDLGLLVVDEEQRFGVAQKEQIKKYKQNIDILTLSATPIPRTLQMSMVGIRNLVLIETPPNNRYPIQTYVLEENNYVIKDAIYKELSRKGQVYILCNKIKEFESKISEIKKLIPEIKIGYAHGKMNKTEIEDVMLKFVNQEFNVLLCTTIIETGIDIPNVNTLIIMDADRFGLSQLYQIRGRVGRSDKIAYAYLMYSKKKVLSEIATKRLSAIKEFAQLGSGFSIAMRDLSIRGAGDILGREQSGFIDSIGIELYIKMLNEEVEKLKGNIIIDEEEEEQPLLNVETHIDDKYVSDDELKIEIHKMINQIKDIDSLNKIKKEIEDRFGKISESMEIYMYQEWFENLKNKKGIEKVNQTDRYIELVLNEYMTNNTNIENLFNKVYKISSNFKLGYSNRRLSIVLNIKDLEKHWIYYLIELLDVI